MDPDYDLEEGEIAPDELDAEDNASWRELDAEDNASWREGEDDEDEFSDRSDSEEEDEEKAPQSHAADAGAASTFQQPCAPVLSYQPDASIASSATSAARSA